MDPGSGSAHGAVLCLCFSGVLCLDVTGQLLVSGSADGVVAVWSLVDKHLLHVLQGHSGETSAEEQLPPAQVGQ